MTEKIVIGLNFPYGFKDIYNFIQASSPINKQRKSVELVLSELSFIRPLTTLSIVECVIALINNNFQVSIVYPKDVAAKKYLMDIGLVDFCKENWISSSGKKFSVTRSCAPIQRLESAGLNQYISEIKTHIKRNISNKDITSIGILISEIVNNVYDHSDDQAYCFMQYFPQNKEMLFVATDHGVGIVNKVKSYVDHLGQKTYKLGDKNYSFNVDIDYLHWALQLGHTTKSTPRNAGKGLDNLITTVKSTKGSRLLIYSNSCMYYVDATGKESFTNNPIKKYVGTCIELAIQTENLPEEEEDMDFEFIF
jgi:hypothetical protein